MKSPTAISWIERERGAVISGFLYNRVIILCILQKVNKCIGGAVELAALSTSEIGCLVD